MAGLLFDLLHDVPPVTSTILGAATACMAATSLNLVTPYALMFSAKRIATQFQLWRAATSMLYFGGFEVSFFWSFYMVLLYGGRLESDNYSGRRADLVWALFLIGLMINLCAAFFLHSVFLDGAFISALTYLWGRKNPDVRMMVFFFAVPAPYVAWVLTLISFLSGMPVTDGIIGVLSGHIIYFFEDIFPQMPVSKGKRLLKAPRALALLLKQPN